MMFSGLRAVRRPPRETEGCPLARAFAAEKAGTARLTPGPSLLHGGAHAQDHGHRIFDRRPPPVRGRLGHHSPPATRWVWWGRNGTGKTTLFKLIRGELTLDTGAIEVPKASRIGGVAQEVPGSDTSLLDTVLAADTERASLLEESHTATDPAPDRRNPDPVAGYRRLVGRGARHDDPQGAGLHRRGNPDALLCLLGRLADAGGAGVRAVCGTRPAAAGRADQLPRPSKARSGSNPTSPNTPIPC